MNATSGKLTATLARIPILGYVLKVVHDFLKLPVLRADLQSEFLDLAERGSRQEADLHEIGERIEQIQAGIEEETREQETVRAGVSERLALLEWQGRAIKEQFDTLFQRVSDNLAEWVDLRQRLSGVESDSAACHQGLASQLDGSARELRELQSRMNAQEETFAEVLRRHGRALAVLQESIAAHSAASQVPLDVFAGVVELVKSLQAEMRSAAEGRHAAVERSEREASARPLIEPARSMRPEVRINLGGGARPMKFCLQVAAAEGADTDVIADPGELPFPPASIAEIYADHLIESCNAKEGRRLLSYWSGLLRPEGTLHLTVTDLESAARSFANTSSSFEDLTRAILGRNGVRQNAFSREALHRLLQDSGFHPVAEEPVEDGCGFEFEIHATKAVRQFLPRRTRSMANV